MKILMYTIGFPPKEVGGTEVYVAGLVDALARRGHDSEVAYLKEIDDGSDIDTRSEIRQGTNVHVVTVPRSRYQPEFLFFDEILRSRLVREFCGLARRIAPDVVHVHPLQLGLESYVMKALRREGHHVVLTCHSSTTTCARGDMVRFGREVCDGRILQTRCTECLMHRKGVPRAFGAILAELPPAWYRAAHKILRLASLRKLRSFVSLSLLIDERKQAWNRTIAAAERIVTVSEWLKRAAILNDAPSERIVFSRHGRELNGAIPAFVPSAVARFGYLGRLSPEKGIDVLLEAVKRVGQDIPFELEFVSATLDSSNRSTEEERVVDELEAAAAADPRLRLLGRVPDGDLARVLASWDALIVPSLWLESGPQVVYEAFSAKTPVVGSRRGGIAELVKEGKTGFLFTAGNSADLAGLLSRFAKSPGEPRALRSQIPPVRTTDDVADDMLAIYQGLCSSKFAA